MKLKRRKYLGIAFASLFLFTMVVSAYSIKNFKFQTLGERGETVEDLPDGSYYLSAKFNETDVDATLGMSLSKKGLFGNFNFVDRCNVPTYGRSSQICTYDNQKKGTYKGTVVFNTSNDGKRLTGTYYLTNF